YSPQGLATTLVTCPKSLTSTLSIRKRMKIDELVMSATSPLLSPPSQTQPLNGETFLISNILLEITRLPIVFGRMLPLNYPPENLTETEVLSTVWHVAIGDSNPKPGKHSSNPLNYRPIAHELSMGTAHLLRNFLSHRTFGVYGNFCLIIILFADNLPQGSVLSVTLIIHLSQILNFAIHGSLMLMICDPMPRTVPPRVGCASDPLGRLGGTFPGPGVLAVYPSHLVILSAGIKQGLPLAYVMASLSLG
ncbi:hypothetical protein AVEN_119204-1, partial [Araneus ventricosus]